jgi:hypothetical protein
VTVHNGQSIGRTGGIRATIYPDLFYPAKDNLLNMKSQGGDVPMQPVGKPTFN